MRSNLFRFMCLIFLPATLLAQTNPASEPKAATDNKRGVITGQVLADDGQPLIGVGVSVFSQAGARSAGRPATTDEDGNFKVNDLPPGSYSVLPRVNGYVHARHDAFRQRYRLGESVTITMTKGGVITGKVYDAAGQPLVGAVVQAKRIRDDAGRANIGDGLIRDASSDDRGVYRIYGLDAGSYLVSTNGGYGLFSNDQFKEAPTYHPNSTHDTAQEVSVQPGAIVTAIDIRHRGERGYVISGMFSGLYEQKSDASTNINVQLMLAATGALVTQANVSVRYTGKNAFAFQGIADGEYELVAQRRNFNRQAGEDSAASTVRKVTVKGADVTGIELRLLPLASIAGRVTMETIEKKDCPLTRRGVMEEVSLTYQRDERDTRTLGTTETAPDEKNEFGWQELLAGRYRLATMLPSDHWYLKAMTVTAKPTTAKTPASKPLDVARQGLDLKAGEKLTGVTLTIAEGAAELRGRVTGTDLPARLRVHLIPAEKDDDVLRYFEVVTRDGAFTFGNLAPGKYWLVTRLVPEDESDEKPAKPVAWDANERAKLRREAVAANNAIELTACQRVKDFSLKFGK